MSTLNGQWVELFRAGDYGDNGSYTTADIDKMIALYDPGKHEAPVVVGHPKDDAPAYGWVEKLRRVGDVLQGRLKQVPAAFEELVRAGSFKKRSISFYRTASGPALRHVGFLGAMPPEVKGLADVKLASFSAGEAIAVDFNEKEDEMDPEQMQKSFMESLKKFFSDLMKPKTVAEMNEKELDKRIADAIAESAKKFEEQLAKFAGKPKGDADGDDDDDDDEEDDEPNSGKANAKKKKAAASYAEAQIKRVKDGQRWIPAFDKMGIPQIFTELALVETKVSFGEGDKKVEKPHAEVFADFLLALPKMVPDGQIVVTTAASGKGAKKSVRFTEPSPRGGVVVDMDSVSLAEAAKDLSTKEKISYGEALTRLRASGEYEPGAAAVGNV